MRKNLTLVASLAFAAALCAGVGAANVQADAAGNYSGFAITATSVRYDDLEKDGVDSGLRFKVDVPTGATVTNAYTKVTLTPKSGTYAGQSVTSTVPATVWRKDNSGWNTVMIDIPATDYATEITAQAFATINGVEYETAAVTSSIAKTASEVMNSQNAMEEALNVYVTDVESITLNETSVAMVEGESVQLTATVDPVDYKVVWTSDNTEVATVDNTGKVTALKAGTVNITAQMGDKSATCAVAVDRYFDGTFESYTVSDQNLTGKGYRFSYSSGGVYISEDKTDPTNQVLRIGANNKNDNPIVAIKLNDKFINDIYPGDYITFRMYGFSTNSNVTKVHSGVGTSASMNLKGEFSFALDTWTNIKVQVSESALQTLKTNKELHIMVGTDRTDGTQLKGGTFYIDDLKVQPQFDGTFESMTVSEPNNTSEVTWSFSYSSGAGRIRLDPTDENNKTFAVGANKKNDNPIVKVTLGKGFFSRLAVGDSFKFRMYVVGYNDNVTGATSGVGLSTKMDLKSEFNFALETWTEITVVVDTQEKLDALQSSGVIHIMVGTTRADANETKGGWFYMDDFTIVKA